MTSPIKRIKLDTIFQEIKELKTDTLLFIIDKKVEQLYHSQLRQFLASIKNKTVHIYSPVAGEEFKNLNQLTASLEFFLEKNIHRSSHMIAIGGGATSDFSGLVASLLLRGISFSIIPTTLLAMIDAAIGGKVGINSQHGKNLIGDFYAAKNIWIDDHFLKTLPPQQFQSGLGELLKYAFLDLEIYNMIENKAPLEKIILSCANYKEKITTEDFMEAGQRKYLNLGHTLGHILEKMYSLPHGIAVFWGLYLKFLILNKLDHQEKLLKLASILNFNHTTPPWENHKIDTTLFFQFLSKDKKIISQNQIEIIDIAQIGEPIIKSINLDQLKQLITTTIATL